MIPVTYCWDTTLSSLCSLSRFTRFALIPYQARCFVTSKSTHQAVKAVARNLLTIVILPSLLGVLITVVSPLVGPLDFPWWHLKIPAVLVDFAVVQSRGFGIQMSMGQL